MKKMPELNKGVKFNWQLLYILTTATITLGIARDGIASVFPFIQSDFALTRTQVGLCSTFIFATSSGIAVFSGRIVDILGAKMGMITGVIIIGVFISLFSVANSFFLILVFSLCLGAGISIITPATSKGVMQWFSVQNRATAMGFVQAGIGVGSFFIAFILPLLSEIYGWRKIIIIPGILAFIIAIFIFSKYPGSNYKQDKTDSNKGINSTPFHKVVFSLLKNRYFLIICFFGFAFGLGFGAINTHYILYLCQDHHLTRTIAGWGFSFMHIGGIFGRFGWGYVSDHLFKGSRKAGLVAISLSLALLTLIFNLITGNYSFPLYVIFILSFLLGISALGFFGLYSTYVGEIVGEKNIGTAIGLSVTFCRFGLLVSPPIFGYIADLRGSYDHSWLGLSILLFISSFIFLYLINIYEGNKVISYHL